jgi:hypothetical protein
MIPAYLSTLLEDGARAESSQGPARLERRAIGELRLPSGRIVACDAVVEPEYPPFARTVAPGAYAVHLAIAHFDGGDQRIAAAWLHFAAGVPARWEPAELAGRAGKRAEYGVDSGTGAFLSAEAVPAVARRLDAGFAEAAAEAMQTNYADTRDWAVLPVPDTDGLDIALFSSGMGDGSYASYWGLDERGEPVCLLTDFGLLEAPERAAGAAESSDPDAVGPRRPWWKR